MTLGQKIREIRTNKKMSMEDVARGAGIPRTVIWKTEHGSTLPRVDTMKKIIAGLRVIEGSKDWKELHALLGGERTGHGMSPALTAGIEKVAVENQSKVKAFLKILGKLSPDDFEEINKAVSRPTVLAGVRTLNALYERKG